MKSICLFLMMAFSTAVFAQGDCDVKIDAKSYTIKFVVLDQVPAQPGGGGKDIAYKITITNKSAIKLAFDGSVWGDKVEGKNPASINTIPLTLVSAGKTVTINGKVKAYKVEEIKVKATKPGCQTNGKNVFMDPSFYKTE